MLALAVFLSACGSSAPATEAEMPHDEIPAAEAAMPHDVTATPEAPPTEAPMEEAAMESPAWFSTVFTDVRTGQAFTINDLKGKVVLVETMAVWCSNCYTQQTEIRSLHSLLGDRDDFVSISLDIDPYEDAATLQGFVNQTGFDWLYAISPAETSRELALAYGDQFLNPPSTPILIVDRHGVAHPLPFGIKRADSLFQTLQAYLSESM
jgi:cytochrome oxidase Cu insertion factor (SCO1/SenC/PrrC family)